jgi:EAL and modified HD-GYP domain-containing signal transduction protein
MQQYFLGRQPILDVNQNIFAYEILFRKGYANFAKVEDNKQSTFKTLLNLFEKFGIENVLGSHLGFLNFDDELIMSDLLELIPKEKFIIEILEYSNVTTEFIKRIAYLHDKGYIFALDDFTCRDSYIRFKPIFNYVSFIKVDIKLVEKDKIIKKIDTLKKAADMLLAEKVETQEEFDFFKTLGFKYFQGYFFARPTVLRVKQLQPSQVNIIKLIYLINKNESLNKIEETIKTMVDVALNLLRFINSAAFGIQKKITSIKEAVNLLGYNKLKIWVIMTSYCDKADFKKSPVFETAAIRGKIMELLCSSVLKTLDKDSAFLVGMLSLIDIVFKQPKEEILNQMNVEDSIKEAVINKSNTLGKLLSAIEYDEQKNYKKLEETLQELNIPKDQFYLAKMGSYSWLNRLLKEF